MYALLRVSNILTVTQIEQASDSEAAPGTALTEALSSGGRSHIFLTARLFISATVSALLSPLSTVLPASLMI